MLEQVSAGEALQKKYPESVACAVCADAEGNPNIIPLGWFMQTSFEPPMCAISVGHTRYSHELIEDRGEFVAAFPAEGFEEDVLYCGTRSGRDVDKFAETSFTPAESDAVESPLIAEAVANLECRVDDALETGDHTIFTGKIVAAHVNRGAGRRIFNMGEHDLKPLP